jgi:hypothetical protein
MPTTKSGLYPKWIHSFPSYWAIDDHHERQKLLVEYFIACGTICRPPTSALSAEEIELTVTVMKTILADNVISKPFELGKMRHQKEKRFNILRQCVTAESFFVLYNIPKDSIQKFHVTHSIVPEKEEERCQCIHGTLGIERDHSTFASTPVSNSLLATTRGRRDKKKEDDKNTVLLSCSSSSSSSSRKVLGRVNKDVTETTAVVPVIVTPTSSRPFEDTYQNNPAGGFTIVTTPCSIVTHDLSAEIDELNVGGRNNSPDYRHHSPHLVHDPRSNHDDTIPLPPQDAPTNKKKLIWSQDEMRQLARDTITRKAQKVLELLHDLSQGNIVLANSIMLKVQKQCDHELTGHHSTGYSENRLGNKNNKEKIVYLVIENIRKMLDLPQFKSKGGTRQSQVQHTLYAIWTSMMGPSEGLGEDKKRISHRALTKILHLTPNHGFLKKCQMLRDELESGVEIHLKI